VTTVISFLLVTLRLLLGGQPSQEDTFKDSIYIEHIWFTRGQLGHQQQRRQEEDVKCNCKPREVISGIQEIVSSSLRCRRDAPRPAPPFFPAPHVTSPAAPLLLSHRRTQPLAASRRPQALSSSTSASIQQEQSAGQGRRPARHRTWSCSPNSCLPRCCSSLVTSTEGQPSSLLGTGGCRLCFDKVDAHKRIFAPRASTSLTSSYPSSTSPWPAEEAHRWLHTRHNLIHVIYNH
jgi:hypothetical protein